MSEQPQGNFIVGQTRKDPASNYPDFTGRLSLPGGAHEHGVAVWAGRDKTGKLYFSGRINPTPITENAMAQLESLTDRPVHDLTDVTEAAANLQLRPYQLVCFANRFKEPNETDTPEEAEKRAKRPDFWGRLNPGDGSPVVALSIWADQDRYGRPILRGAISYPVPGKPEAMIEPDGLDELLPPVQSKGANEAASR